MYKLILVATTEVYHKSMSVKFDEKRPGLFEMSSNSYTVSPI